MIREQSTAPSFSLPGTAGEEIKQYSLDELTESGPTILAFYPFGSGESLDSVGFDRQN